MQSEYIQLTKTLYTLLQDSPDEHQLFQAVGNVAHNLLSIGEINAKSVIPDSPFPPSSSSPFEIRKHSLPPESNTRCDTTPPQPASGDSDSTDGQCEDSDKIATDLVGDKREGEEEREGRRGEGEEGGGKVEGEGEGKGEGEGGVIKDEKPSNDEADTHKKLSPPRREGESILTSGHIPLDKESTSPDVTVCDVTTPPTLSQSIPPSDQEVGMVSTPLGELKLEQSKSLKTVSGEAGPVVSSGGEPTSLTLVSTERPTAIDESHSQAPVLHSNTNQSESQDSMETTPLQPSPELPGLLTADSSDGPSQMWYITFEQFISSIQTEPELCQFFAEQNTIDLDSSSVDPLLTPYTRTVLIHR